MKKGIIKTSVAALGLMLLSCSAYAKIDLSKVLQNADSITSTLSSVNKDSSNARNLLSVLEASVSNDNKIISVLTEGLKNGTVTKDAAILQASVMLNNYLSVNSNIEKLKKDLASFESTKAILEKSGVLKDEKSSAINSQKLDSAIDMLKSQISSLDTANSKYKSSIDALVELAGSIK